MFIVEKREPPFICLIRLLSVNISCLPIYSGMSLAAACSHLGVFFSQYRTDKDKHWCCLLVSQCQHRWCHGYPVKQTKSQNNDMGLAARRSGTAKGSGEIHACMERWFSASCWQLSVHMSASATSLIQGFMAPPTYSNSDSKDSDNMCSHCGKARCWIIRGVADHPQPSPQPSQSQRWITDLVIWLCVVTHVNHGMSRWRSQGELEMAG